MNTWSAFSQFGILTSLVCSICGLFFSAYLVHRYSTSIYDQEEIGSFITGKNLGFKTRRVRFKKNKIKLITK